MYVVVHPHLGSVEPWGNRPPIMRHVVCFVLLLFDSVDLDDDLSIVSASLPLKATEFCRAEKGIGVHLKPGGKRADAQD